MSVLRASASAWLVVGALLGESLAQVTHVDFLVENLSFSELKRQASDVEMLARSAAWTVALFFNVDASAVSDLHGRPEHVFVAAGEMLMPWSKKDWPVARAPGGNRTFLSASVQLPGMGESAVEAKIRSKKCEERLAGDIAETFGSSGAVTGTLRVIAAQAAVVGRPAPIAASATRPALTGTSDGPSSDHLRAPLPRPVLTGSSDGLSSDHLMAPLPRPPAPTPVRNGSAGEARRPAAARNSSTGGEEAQKSAVEGPTAPPEEASNGAAVWNWLLLAAGCALCAIGLVMCTRELGRRHANYRQCWNMSPRNFARKQKEAPKASSESTSAAGAYLGSLLDTKRPLGYTGP